MKIHILEYNFDDPRGPKDPCCWHYNDVDEYPLAALELFLNRVEAWIPVCMTTNENYQEEFDQTKKCFCDLWESYPQKIKKRWLNNEQKNRP